LLSRGRRLRYHACDVSNPAEPSRSSIASTHEDVYEFSAEPAGMRWIPSILRQVRAVVRGWDQVRVLAMVRYRGTHARTVFGTLWWYLDPLMQTVVFSFLVTVVMGRSSFETGGVSVPYGLGILCTLVPWKWFSATLMRASKAVVEGQAILSRAKVDAVVFVTAHVREELRNAVFGFVIFAGVAWWFGRPPGTAALALPAVMAVQLLLTLGPALLAANYCVFFRDLNNFLPTFLNVLFYLSPVLYSADQVPGGFGRVLRWNPLAPVLTSYQAILLENRLPDAGPLAASAAFGFVLLGLGLWRFDRNESYFLKYL